MDTGHDASARIVRSAVHDDVHVVGTKIVPPAAPHRIVARSRVTACFEDATAARLTLVTGPPGIGKTVAVHEWTRTLDTPVAWLTLDAQDNDVRQFTHDVAAAVRRVAPEIAEPLAAADEPHAGLVLVLDDFQAVTSRATVEELRTLLERKHPSFTVVVVSRCDPTLPLARWRARGELCDVRDGDLRLRTDEALAYLSTFGELDLDERSATALAKRMEGWIAGLQLAAISLRGRDDPAAFVERFSGTDRFIADFLLDEVLDRQPADVRDLLLDTSVLTEFDADLCGALTGRHDANGELRRLEAANLFLVRDEEGVSFRYHSLFRDLLRSELDTRAPGHARRLRERAATLVAERGDRVAAVQLLLDAGNPEAALELATSRAPEPDARSRLEARASLALVPAEYVAGDEDRMIRFADALLDAGCEEDVVAWLARAASFGRATPDRAGHAHLDALWGKYYAMQGEADLAIRRSRRALDDSARDGRLRGDRVIGALRVQIARSWLIIGNTQRARRSLGVGDPFVDDLPAGDMAVHAVLARISSKDGRLRDAEVEAERALRLADALDARCSESVLDALLASARVSYERNDLAAASGILEDASIMASDLSSVPYTVLVELARSSVVAALAGPAAGFEHVENARVAFGGTLPRPLVDAVDRVDARLSVLSGDVDRAVRLVNGLPASVHRELLSAVVDLASGRGSAARDRLAALRPVRLIDSVRVEVLRAVTSSDLDAQRRHVAAAAGLAAPEGLRRELVNGGAVVVRAARSLMTSAELHPVTVGFLASIADLPPVSRRASAVEPLTERERSVLRYLTTPLDYRDIASELLISANTLKTHVMSIHRKLGASSRAEVVEQARELGFIGRR